MDLAAEQIPWLFSGVVVRRADLAKPDLIVRFLKAAIEGNHLALTNEGLAKQVLAKELKLTNRKDHRHQLRGLQGAVAAQYGALGQGRRKCDRPDRRRGQPETSPTTWTQA